MRKFKRGISPVCGVVIVLLGTLIAVPTGINRLQGLFAAAVKAVGHCIVLVRLPLVRRFYAHTPHLQVIFTGKVASIYLSAPKAGVRTPALPNHVLVLIAMVGVIGIGFFIVLSLLLTLRSRTKKKMTELTFIDSLTKLDNYTAFADKANLLLTEDERYAYVLFDINRFKAINNTYGFEEGDRLLEFVAHKLNEFVLEGEVFARASDDNFAALLRFESEETLVVRLKSLFGSMQTHRASRRQKAEYQLNYACGVFVVCDNAVGLDYCHENAQMAKCRVKELYDTTISFYNNTLRQRVAETQEIETSMYSALENREFEVYLQPKYDLKTETIAGAEALIRWHHPTMGFLTPGRFIPILEQNGFLLKLDGYVHEEVCRVLRAWIDAGETPFPISVNMSRLHAKQNDFVERLAKMVDQYGISPGLIEIELTETAFLDDTQQIIDVMQRLKEKGFMLAMDDFGSGYSSLNLLNLLPVDIIKLDRMMFNDTDKLGRSKKVVTNAMNIVRDLDMKAVAEGIETREQVDFLKGIDCDMVQGFFFAKPMPVSQFEELAYNRVISGDTRSGHTAAEGLK
ncbi:MAG: putative bifunctional diguanylate cyclase/phosphodiesterase [Acetanaerobacterium sp.]